VAGWSQCVLCVFLNAFSHGKNRLLTHHGLSACEVRTRMIAKEASS
jgi:hypothetical protein